MEYKNMEMAGSPNELIQGSSNYKKYNAYLSRIRYARVPLNNVSSSSIPISLNATQLMEWKIPAKTVINLAKSYITYSYAPVGLASNNAVVFETGQDLCSWLYFGDGGGLGIADVNYADRYINVIAPLRTNQEEFLSKDQLGTCYPSNNYAFGNAAALNHGVATTNLLPFSQDGLTGGTINSSANDYIEQQYLRISTSQGTGSPMIVSRQLPLSTFKDTFVGMDKNCIFGRDMYLRMNTMYGSRLGYFCTNPATPSVNVTAFTAATMPQAYANVFLFLAVEENKVLVDSLMSALLAGSIRYTIPYTYVYRFGASGTSSNMSITLTRQFGHKLKRVLFSSFVGSETSNQSFNHSNFNGTKIATLQSSIDSRPLTDYQLNCFNPNLNINPSAVTWTYPSTTATVMSGGSISGDDYREMRDKLVGSCIPSYLSYQINWCYADQWGLQSMAKNFTQSVDDGQIDDGLNLLDADHVYTLQLTTPQIPVASSDTANSLVHYLFALFVRNLAVSAEGISFN